MNTNKILVFVYGTLKKGGHNHRLLAERGAKFISTARTRERYPLVITGLPFLLNASAEGYRVTGEVYEVDQATFRQLDALEGHPRFYKREQIEVQCGGNTWTAWTYFIAPESPRFEHLKEHPFHESFATSGK